MIKRRTRMSAVLFLAVMSVSGFAAASALEDEIGVSLSNLDAKGAERLLNRYVEGKVLPFAGKAARIELLTAIVKAAEPASVVHKRAELLLQSVKTSSRK